MKTPERAMTEWATNRIVFDCGKSFRKYFCQEEMRAISKDFMERVMFDRKPARTDKNKRFGRLIYYMAKRADCMEVFKVNRLIRFESLMELFECVLRVCESKGMRFEDLHKKASQSGYDVLSLGKLAKYIKGWK